MNAQTSQRVAWLVVLALLVVAPFVGIYPVFMMKALCFAIFACAFNLLLGFTGLLSFGHAAFLGSAAYATKMVEQGFQLVTILSDNLLMASAAKRAVAELREGIGGGVG